MLRGGFGRSQRVESRTRVDFEVLAAALVVRWTWRDHSQQGIGQPQDFGPQRSEDRRERAPLLGGRNDLCWSLSVTAQGKGVIHAANQFASRLHLIPMRHVERNEHVFESRQRR